METPEIYKEQCEAAYEWTISDESMQSARWMSKNVIEGIDQTFEKWKPRYAYDFVKVESLKQPKHFVKHVITQ